jgi:hypothetical protein
MVVGMGPIGETVAERVRAAGLSGARVTRTDVLPAIQQYDRLGPKGFFSVQIPHPYRQSFCRTRPLNTYEGFRMACPLTK